MTGVAACPSGGWPRFHMRASFPKRVGPFIHQRVRKRVPQRTKIPGAIAMMRPRNFPTKKELFERGLARRVNVVLSSNSRVTKGPDNIRVERKAKKAIEVIPISRTIFISWWKVNRVMNFERRIITARIARMV